jgi:excisionase family DNA binding protein
MGTAPTTDRPVPLLLSVEGAAAYLGISVRALQGLRERREVSVVRLGKRIWFRPEDLDALVKARLEPALRGPLAPARPRLLRQPT